MLIYVFYLVYVLEGNMVDEDGSALFMFYGPKLN